MRRCTFAMLALLLATTAFAVESRQLYDLRYEVTPDGARIAFDVSLVEIASGRSVLQSTMRTRAGEWGSLHTTHRGRDIRVRMRGETNGYAELTLEVRAHRNLLQRTHFKYTERAAAPPTRYRGEPITLHLRDADLRDVIVALAKLTKTNIAIDPGVTGTVTIDLVNVPSDQALELILKQHGLARVVDGRVTAIRRLQ